MAENVFARPGLRVSPAHADGSDGRARAFERTGLVRRILPFALVALISLLAVSLTIETREAWSAGASAILTGLAIGLAFFAPWSRLPRWAEVIPPLLYVAAAMLLRDFAGGYASGIVTLYALPIVWVALYGRARDVAIVTTATILAMLGPIVLIGGPAYPAEEWQRLAINGAIALLGGGTIYRLTMHNHRLLRDARVHAEALAEGHARVRAILRSAQDAIVTLSPSGRILNVNPAAEAMFRGGRADLVGRDLIATLAVDEEKAFLRDGMARLDSDLAGTTPRIFGTELIRLDGEAFPADVTVGLTTEDGATVVHAFARDVSDRRRAEAAAQAHQASLASLLDVAMQLTDPTEFDTVRTTICDASVQLTGAVLAVLLEPDGDELAVTAAAGKPIPSVRIPVRGQTSACATVYRSGAPLFSRDMRTDARAWRTLALQAGVKAGYCQPIPRAKGVAGVLAVAWADEKEVLDPETESILGVLASQAGVALEMATLVRHLDSLARTDGLTGIANRRTFDETLAVEIDRARRSTRPLSLMLLDLDHFKRYNDARGHQAGDRLLVALTAAWSRELRPADLLARYGGEEFAVILPDCSVAAAVRIADRLRGSIPDGQTVSGGVASLEPADGPADLVARADAGLYRAKAAGRNRVEVG